MEEGFETVSVWDRRRGETRAEPVFRGGTLRFLFRNPIGRLAMRTLLSTKWFNHLLTRRQRSPRSRCEISPFIDRYKIDASEFVEPVASFRSFADFFIRELRPESRPIASVSDVVVAPSDGRIQWVFPALREDAAFEVKGTSYTLGQLVGDVDLAKSFAGGTLLGIYLSPFDYHRFCYPGEGQLISQRRLGRRYYSVNARSLAAGFRVFDHNVRQSTVLSRGDHSWAMVEVAGFYAGGIVNLDDAAPGKTRGMMKGYFQLGGSFIVLAFQAGAIRLDQDILEMVAGSIEVRIRLGERIGAFEAPAATSS